MFYISVSNGILDGKHRQKMQISQKTSCIWIYLWLLDKVTKIDEETNLGRVLGGKPIKIEEDLQDFGNRKTVIAILKKLEQEGYIKTVRTPYGKSIFVTKAKKFFGNKIEKRSVKSGTSLQESGTSLYQKKQESGTSLPLKSKESGTSNKTIQYNNTIKDNTEEIYPQHNPTSWSIINDMYSYEPLDENGNPFKKNKKRITKQENETLISVGFMWQSMCSEYLGLDEKDIPMKNLYYPIRACYDRNTNWTKKHFGELFEFFLNDKDIKEESKLSFDLALSEKYVAKYKLKKKLQEKHSSGTFDIKL